MGEEMSSFRARAHGWGRRGRLGSGSPIDVRPPESAGDPMRRRLGRSSQARAYRTPATNPRLGARGEVYGPLSGETLRLSNTSSEARRKRNLSNIPQPIESSHLY